MYYPTKEEFIKDFDFSNPVRLGQGAFGKVYKLLCKSENSPLEKGKYYAAKQIEVINEQMFNKIQNEFKINQLINMHPNVINVVKVYAWQELMPKKFSLLLVMELADRSLQKEIHTRKQERSYFSAFQLLELFKKCLLTFSTLVEQKQIFHRDIKPENILILEADNLIPKITDFGVSKSLHELNIQESLKNTIVGTPVYFSPILWNAFVTRSEQPSSFEKIKHDLEKSDIFSLGLTFLQCTLLLTTEIVGLNMVEQKNKRNMFLDKVENARIRNLITDMLQYEECDRKTYKELIQLYFNSNQKGIFEETPSPQKMKQINQIVCVKHQNCKALYYCFKLVIAGYYCEACYQNDDIQLFCIPLPEKNQKQQQSQKETLEEYFESSIQIIFIKAIKDQINFAKQTNKPPAELEKNIQQISKFLIFNQNQTQNQVSKLIKGKLEEIRTPYKEYLNNELYNEALRYLELNKEKIYELTSDLILRLDKLTPNDEVQRQKKKIFDSSTQQILPNSLQSKKEI
ncbi:unnamed protein product (macronuclear) [Paramecium tetraurelia]|uniref:non-specific serine/threonine protein kinase n=1 Tax=Paramecium tetraurelia TaxID=5888 RepID=A0DFZ6_PARTE|nr:uncharacterized protein GSPATT00002091001 [Paramecium tetraurelia]CAK81963.1 unnamed protein product [Paramecium tetraurelia]|eukprot:XP_001449360.1 hypothetical protein (macronuclear) [Paramecium tetraurelia strain d4-2]